MKRWISLAVLLMLAFAPLASAADEPGPITWLAFETTKPGKSRALINATIEQDGPMYDELLAAGTLTSWGIAIPITHTPRDHMNYMLWATMSGWDKVGGLQAGFEKMFASRTPEQMAESMKSYREAVVEDSHHDWIIRHRVYRQSEGDQAPKYFYIGYYKATPGHEEKVSEFYKEHVQPVYDKLLADGTITSFGLSRQELHGVGDWTHIGWYTMPDLGAIDTVGQAIDAVFTPELSAEIEPMMDFSAHWDQVLLITHIGGTKQEE